MPFFRASAEAAEASLHPHNSHNTMTNLGMAASPNHKSPATVRRRARSRDAAARETYRLKVVEVSAMSRHHSHRHKSATPQSSPVFVSPPIELGLQRLSSIDGKKPRRRLFGRALHNPQPEQQVQDQIVIHHNNVREIPTTTTIAEPTTKPTTRFQRSRSSSGKENHHHHLPDLTEGSSSSNTTTSSIHPPVTVEDLQEPAAPHHSRWRFPRVLRRSTIEQSRNHPDQPQDNEEEEEEEEERPLPPDSPPNQPISDPDPTRRRSRSHSQKARRRSRSTAPPSASVPTTRTVSSPPTSAASLLLWKKSCSTTIVSSSSRDPPGSNERRSLGGTLRAAAACGNGEEMEELRQMWSQQYREHQQQGTGGGPLQSTDLGKEGRTGSDSSRRLRSKSPNAAAAEEDSLFGTLEPKSDVDSLKNPSPASQQAPARRGRSKRSPFPELEGEPAYEEEEESSRLHQPDEERRRLEQQRNGVRFRSDAIANKVNKRFSTTQQQQPYSSLTDPPKPLYPQSITRSSPSKVRMLLSIENHWVSICLTYKCAWFMSNHSILFPTMIVRLPKRMPVG